MTDLPLIKIFIVAVFVLILIALGSAARNLFRRGGDRDSTATVKALTVRVALSFALVIALAVLYALGIIEPNG
jgi:hypothetical protein